MVYGFVIILYVCVWYYGMKVCIYMRARAVSFYLYNMHYYIDLFILFLPFHLVTVSYSLVFCRVHHTKLVLQQRLVQM